MASEYTIPQILQIAKISQYLASNDRQAGLLLNSGSLVQQLPEILYTERVPFEYIYNLNPDDPNIRNVAEYILSLCGKYAQKALAIINGLTVGLPVLTGPVNQSVLVGQTATFSVSAVGVGPFVYQWFLGGIPILGATGPSYSKINSQLTDSGTLYSVSVTNAAGIVFSNTATLTVTNSILLYAYYSDIDPTADVQAQIDNFAYQFTVIVSHNQPINIPIPQSASNNKWWVWRVVNTEQINNTWFNSTLNSGQIPDSVFYAPAQFGSNIYYYLRNASSFDFTLPLILSKV